MQVGITVGSKRSFVADESLAEDSAYMSCFHFIVRRVPLLSVVNTAVLLSAVLSLQLLLSGKSILFIKKEAV